jgi:hypothetical protein
MTFTAPLAATTNPFTGGVVGISVNAASTAACGAVQLADTSATQAGVSTALAVTPAGAAATYLPFCDFTAKGQLIVGTGANAYCIFAPGANGQALLACSTCTEGVYWGSPLQPATPTTIGGICGFAAGTGGNFSAGGGSLAAVSTGLQNTALGNQAATSLTSGCGNTALGAGALALETAGGCNVAVGACALYNSNGGALNVAVGGQAGQNITTGDNNVILGSASGGNVTTQNNQVVIGANGNSCTIACANGGVTFAGGAGAVTWVGIGNTLWQNTSDARLKEDVADLALGLDFISQVQPRTFTWKRDGSKAAGFIAQEAAAVVESHDAEYLGFVDDNNEYMGVSAAALIPVLVNAVKELKAEVEALKAKLN